MSIEEAYDLGIDGIFNKPFDRKVLVNCLANALIPVSDRWQRAPQALTSNQQNHFIVFPNFEKARLDHQIGVGRGGMFVLKTENFPMVSDLIRFRIDFEDRPLFPIEGTGWVRWVRPLQAGTLSPGIGVEFQSLTKSSASYVKEILSTFKTTSFIPRG